MAHLRGLSACEPSSIRYGSPRCLGVTPLAARERCTQACSAISSGRVAVLAAKSLRRPRWQSFPSMIEETTGGRYIHLGCLRSEGVRQGIATVRSIEFGFDDFPKQRCQEFKRLTFGSASALMSEGVRPGLRTGDSGMVVIGANTDGADQSNLPHQRQAAETLRETDAFIADGRRPPLARRWRFAKRDPC